VTNGAYRAAVNKSGLVPAGMAEHTWRTPKRPALLSARAARRDLATEKEVEQVFSRYRGA
jgi:hypothetical protein